MAMRTAAVLSGGTMRCLRIYATPDGESHFGEVDIPATMASLFPNEAPLELSVHYPASRIRFVHVPAGVCEAGWHTPPGRVLAVWLDGIVEFETSDGEIRHVSAAALCWWRTHMERATSHVTPWRARASF